ncbi:MAG: hypothetical protein GY863_13885 [bacterium]|nr:hypothetical protein [bacterium]
MRIITQGIEMSCSTYNKSETQEFNAISGREYLVRITRVKKGVSPDGREYIELKLEIPEKPQADRLSYLIDLPSQKDLTIEKYWKNRKVNHIFEGFDLVLPKGYPEDEHIQSLINKEVLVYNNGSGGESPNNQVISFAFNSTKLMKNLKKKQGHGQSTPLHRSVNKPS